MATQWKPPGSTFLTAEERSALCKAKTPFTITDVSTGEGKFGEGHTYTLRIVDPKTGEVVSRFITLSDNARRREEADWTRQQLIEAGPDGIGPVRLEQVATDKGNPAWVFVGA